MRERLEGVGVSEKLLKKKLANENPFGEYKRSVSRVSVRDLMSE